MPVSALLKRCLTVVLVVLDVTSILALCGRALLKETAAVVTLNAAAEHVVLT